MGAAPLATGMGEDSESFLPWLLDAAKEPTPRSPLIHDKWTVRDGDWKLILPKNKQRAKEYPDGELYDLKADRAENRNQIDAKPEKAKRLRKVLAEFLQQSPK